MKNLRLLLLAGLLALFVAPAFAQADAMPPLPRPRPDRNAQPQPPAPTAQGETDRQKLIRTGLPNTEDGDALMPPTV